MRVNVLGGVSIESGGIVAPVRSPRPRLILALLASRHGSVVDEHVLIEAIWGDEPPTQVRTALQTYVSALRDELEPDRPRRSPGRFIERDGHGYALRAEPDELDIAVFEDVIARARRLHRDDRATAIELLDEALDLWRDPPFGEFADAPWAIGASTRLRDAHASALESRFGLALDDGSEATELGRMERAIEAYPYRERLAGQLMLALYRRGEQRRALGRFATTRARLLDDLGLDPGRELQLLERAILAQDPALQTRGRESVTAPTVRPSQVPAAREIVGRDDELRDVADLVRRERCVTIVGPGGVGKTSLAAHVVRELAPAYDGRVHHVDLADLGGRDVMRSLAAALRVVEHPLAPLADSVVDALGAEPSLLVIETCEVAIDDVGAAAVAVLAAPGLHLLLTSQLPLQIRDEHVCRLGPIGVDAALTVLARDGSIKPSDRDTLVQITDRVDRLPLGLELAAARLASLGPEELLRGLESGPDLLVGGADRPARQRSISAAVEWSLGLLTPAYRDVMARLAAFSGAFSLDAARVIVDDDAPLCRVVGELVDRSLVERLGGVSTHFRLPESIRSVIAEVHREVVEATRTRLAEETLACAQARMFGQESAVDLADLDTEVVPALERFTELGDPRRLLLAGLLGMFFIEEGRVTEGREQLSAALAAHPDAPDMIRLAASSQLGFLAWYQGDQGATQRVLSEITGLMERLPDSGFGAVVSGCLAFVEHRFEDASAVLGSALDAGSGATRQRMLLLHMAGNSAWYAGDPALAASRYRQQREMAREVGDDFQLAQSLRFEAMVTTQLGNIEAAWRWAERSLAMSKSMADSVSLAQSSAASAVVAVAADAREYALGYAIDALEASRRHVDVFSLRTAIPIVADAGLRSGDIERAARLTGWYLDLLDRAGHTAWPAVADLAADVVVRARAALGPAEFARESALGAALTLPQLVAEARVLRADDPCGSPPEPVSV